jgi:hypothetical protein
MGNNSREDRAKSAMDKADTTSGNYATSATNISGSLVPQLQKEATNPTGYTPTQQNNMLVAGEQGAGGANAGIVGQAGLQAARTHNTGALSGVLDSAARARQQTLSQNALGVQNRQADLQQHQMESAQKGLEGLYGTDVNADLKAQSLVPEDINAATAAAQTGAQQNAQKWVSLLLPKGLQGGSGGDGGQGG